eukprot:UN04047
MFSRHLLCNNLKNQILSSMRFKPAQQQYKALLLPQQQQQLQHFQPQQLPLIRRFATMRYELNTPRYRSTQFTLSNISTRQLSTTTTKTKATTTIQMFKNIKQISNPHHHHNHHMIPILFQISTRNFFWRRKPQIQGLVTPKMRRTRRVIRWVAFFILYFIYNWCGIYA